MTAADIKIVLGFPRSGHDAWPQMQVENNVGGSPIYVGIGIRGALTSESSWVIFKHTYDANGFYTGTQSSVQDVAWDNRATTTYA